MTSTAVYNELCEYTLSHGGAEFIHQHAVDAIGAQEASPEDNPIRLVFALVGIYLHVERGFTGREVQLAHMKLGRKKQDWPVLSIPQNRGAICAATVVAAPISDRDSMIHDWCRSVWQSFAEHRAAIERILADHGITDSRSAQHPITSPASIIYSLVPTKRRRDMVRAPGKSKADLFHEVHPAATAMKRPLHHPR